MDAPAAIPAEVRAHAREAYDALGNEWHPVAPTPLCLTVRKNVAVADLRRYAADMAANNHTLDTEKTEDEVEQFAESAVGGVFLAVFGEATNAQQLGNYMFNSRLAHNQVQGCEVDRGAAYALHQLQPERPALLRFRELELLAKAAETLVCLTYDELHRRVPPETVAVDAHVFGKAAVVYAMSKLAALYMPAWAIDLHGEGFERYFRRSYVHHLYPQALSACRMLVGVFTDADWETAMRDLDHYSERAIERSAPVVLERVQQRHGPW